MTISSKKNFASVGAIISSTYANNLITDFKDQFPGITAKTCIKRETILSSFENLPNVSGIRFMYGLESADNPGSLTVLLVPCNTTSIKGTLPNVIINPQGYLDHNGNRISLKKTWKLLFNHAIHLSKSHPEIRFHKLIRGHFVGLESLHNFLYNWADSPFIHYHLGYDSTESDYYKANKGVLESLDINRQTNNVFMDWTQPCPDVCPGDDSTCITSRAVETHSTTISTDNELNLFRSYRDNFFMENNAFAPLVEMYYYISPSLIEAIENTGNAAIIYADLYTNQISACKLLLKQKEFDKARILFEQTIDGLMSKYIFS